MLSPLIEFQKQNLKDLGFETNLGGIASPWVGMNILSLDQDVILVDSRQTKLMKVLEQHKVNVIPVQMRLFANPTRRFALLHIRYSKGK